MITLMYTHKSNSFRSSSFQFYLFNSFLHAEKPNFYNIFMGLFVQNIKKHCENFQFFLFNIELE